LIDILVVLKGKRLEAERRATLSKRQNIAFTLLKAYKLERPATDIIPGPADVCEMHEFKTIIEDTPYGVQVTEETFRRAMARLPQLINEWRSAKDAELVHIMNDSVESEHSQSNGSDGENNRKQLELATSLFQCKICCGTIPYPQILIHACTHDLRYTWRHSDDPRCALWCNLLDEPWNIGGEKIGIDNQAKPAGRLIVETCGLDPDTATAQEMDDLDPRLECVKCYSEMSGRLIMGWKMAV
jgi:hypothetical protein